LNSSKSFEQQQYETNIRANKLREHIFRMCAACSNLAAIYDEIVRMKDVLFFGPTKYMEIRVKLYQI
jgi:hypothetical protein